jgi:hypothetical protein
MIFIKKTEGVKRCSYSKINLDGEYIINYDFINQFPEKDEKTKKK